MWTSRKCHPSRPQYLATHVTISVKKGVNVTHPSSSSITVLKKWKWGAQNFTQNMNTLISVSVGWQQQRLSVKEQHGLLFQPHVCRKLSVIFKLHRFSVSFRHSPPQTCSIFLKGDSQLHTPYPKQRLKTTSVKLHIIWGRGAEN